MNSSRTLTRAAASIVAALLTTTAAAGALIAQTPTGGAPAAPPASPPMPPSTAVIGAPVAASPTVVRVCGDPDNLPFSNDRKEGFENKIAELVARDLGKSVAYMWWPHRRGFVRNTLRAKECDLIVGVPGGFDPVASTKPYYRSTYYIMSRTDRKPQIRSIDDPALKKLRVGVHTIGNDYENTPPAHALGTRGVRAVGFPTFYGESSNYKPEDIVNALVDRKIDVAVVWGPLAGYYAKRASVPLMLVPLPDADTTAATRLPFAYNVTMGVRRADTEFRAQLDSVLERRKPEIARILQDYGIPTLPTVPPPVR